VTGFPQEPLDLGPGINSTYKRNLAVDWLQIQREEIGGAMFGCSSRRLKRDLVSDCTVVTGYAPFLPSEGYLFGSGPKMMGPTDGVRHSGVLRDGS
jgi:hypothetical protein